VVPRLLGSGVQPWVRRGVVVVLRDMGICSEGMDDGVGGDAEDRDLS
jgi:hypothetical protein